MSVPYEFRMLSLVVPCYNESASIAGFFDCVVPILDSIERIRFEIVLVNDGSSDDTLDQLLAYARRDERIRVVDLTRNSEKRPR